MDERTLIKSGLSSYTLVLPKDWLRRNKLSKGSKVYLEEENNQLRVLPKLTKKQSPDKEKTILCDTLSIHTLIRDIITHYLTTTSPLTLKGKTLREKLPELHKIITQLAGLEIIEETGDTVVLNDFIDLTQLRLPRLLRRSDNILRSMFVDTALCIKKTDLSLAEAIRLRDKDVNKLTYLVYKCLNYVAENPQEAHHHGITPPMLMQLWGMNNYLEKIGDEIKRLALQTTLTNFNTTEITKLSTLFETIRTFYINTMTALYTNNIPLADKYSEQRDALLAQCDQYLHVSKVLPLRNIVSRMRYLIAHINDVSRLTRHLTFSKITDDVTKVL